MSEQVPNAQHQEMLQAFDQARLAAQEGTYRHEQHNGIEAIGGPLEPHIQHSVRNERPGQQEIMVAGNGKHGRVDGQSTMSTYDARLEWPVGQEGETYAKTQIRRVDTKGNTYSQRFNNPETARKFITLIGKQAAKRARQAGEQKQNAA